MTVAYLSCPERAVLADFLLGRLPESRIQVVEEHLQECMPCGDTIRLLDSGDTADDLVRQIVAAESKTDSAERTNIDAIIKKLQEHDPCGNLNDSGAGTGQTQPERDVVARASEVTSRLGKSNHPDHLGRVAHYEVIRLLGSGGTGVVFKALDTKLQRPVALKILRPSLGKAARERFISEAQTAARISHDQVVTIYHVGEADDLAYMAMQWLPGETLEDRLRRESILSNDVATDIFRQIALGLAAAHENGLIHRDIKPANIWIESDDGRVKILDFGLARVADDDPQFTETGMIAGTPCFMSPEQARGAIVDHRSDLFSLGCVLYRMIAGQLPFQAANVLATLQSIQRYSPPAPEELNSGVCSQLNRLAMCLLEKNAELRPQTAVSVLHALETQPHQWEFRVPDPVGARPNPTPRTRSGGLIRKCILAAILLLLPLGALMYGHQVIRIVTGTAVIEIETDDPNIDIEVMQDGETVKVIDGTTKHEIEIKHGSYQLRAVGGDNSVTIQPNRLTLARGGKEVVRVTVTPVSNADESMTLLPPDESKQQRSRADVIRIVSETITRMEKEIGELTMKYGPDHPEIGRQKQLIVELIGRLSDLHGGNPGPAAIVREELSEYTRKIIELEMQLVELERKFSQQHPRTVELRRKLEVLRNQRQQSLNGAISDLTGPGSPKLPADNSPTRLPDDSSQPVYDGLPLDHWLELARTERKPERTIEVLNALNALTDDASADRVFPVLIEMIRSPAFSSIRSLDSILALLEKVPDRQLTKTFTELIKSEDQHTRQAALRIVYNARRTECLLHSIASVPFLDSILVEIEGIDSSDPQARDWNVRLCSDFYKLCSKERELTSHVERTIAVLQKLAQEKYDNNLILLAAILVDEAPDTPLLPERLGQAVIMEKATNVKVIAIRYLERLGRRAKPAIPYAVDLLETNILEADITSPSQVTEADDRALAWLASLGRDSREALGTLRQIKESLEGKDLLYPLSQKVGAIIRAIEREPLPDLDLGGGLGASGGAGDAKRKRRQ